ncbi:MAG: GGDEF domain-containing protein [Myxococcales bacterium]|nr:GGDEF domain-containing protein [Myxococcales bacterium]
MSDEFDDSTRTVDLGHILAPDEQKTGYLMILSSAAPAVMGKLYKLDRPQTVIGRSRECDVSLDDSSVSRQHARLVHTGDEYRLEDLGSANGTLVNGQRLAQAVLRSGDKLQVGSTTVLLFSLHDQLEEQFRSRVYEAATHDSLTEIYNRKYLEDALQAEFSFCSRHGMPLSAVLVDIDRFKSVNDCYGHLAGDFVLRQLARIVKSVVRSEDVVARYGGEELVMMLRETDAAGALLCAERCRETVQMTRFRPEDRVIPVTISAGVATLRGENFKTPAELVGAADAALYRAKDKGRNRVEVGSE